MKREKLKPNSNQASNEQCYVLSVPCRDECIMVSLTNLRADVIWVKEDTNKLNILTREICYTV